MSGSNETLVALQDVRQRTPESVDRLLQLVYPQLRALAASAMQREAPGHTLDPTAVVHEAYVKLVDQSQAQWQDRTHFFAVAVQAIRRILIDHARTRKAQKRGGGWQRMTLSGAALGGGNELDLLDLDVALCQLAQLHPRQAQVVELKFFGNMTNDEIAEALDISRTTVAGDWTVARAWLSRALSGDG